MEYYSWKLARRELIDTSDMRQMRRRDTQIRCKEQDYGQHIDCHDWVQEALGLPR